MSATFTGPETTANVSSNQNIRDVAPLRYLDADVNAISLIMQETNSSAAAQVMFEWAEKGGDYAGAGTAPKLDQINLAAGYLSTDITLKVDNVAYYSVNDVVEVMRTHEKMLVVAKNTSAVTITVARGVGSTAAVALVDNDDLKIMGTAWAQGADVGVPKEHQESWKYNYIQLFRTPLGASRTKTRIDNYLGNPRTRLRTEKLREHKIDIENAVIFGERNSDTTDTDNPRYWTGGINYWNTSNTTSSIGTLTQPVIWDLCAAAFRHYPGGGVGTSRTLFAGETVISAIDLIAEARVELTPSDETFGIAISTWRTSYGKLVIVKHPLLESGAGGNGYGGEALCLDMRQLKWRPLDNTKLLPDRQGNGIDGWTDEYLTEAGLEFALPAVHGRLSGVTG